ncbi:MAG: hypothetical protein JWQ81_327 [Amycolatopsis sp.]|uniref:hypothetical protein n=1 Tax=Amycolatopsis sp. TaxID=37632 RepID=UPI00263541B7|nr:hypothetical protein [Amycolatopsis sp.]MCU1679588.1 hypothetical protein [Amycolatopsis sp.]
MQALLILSAFAILAALVNIQIKARRMISVHAPTGRRQAGEIVQNYFEPGWRAVSGPGTYNYRPTRMAHPPTISITVNGTDASSQVRIWTSSSDGSFHGTHHASLIWAKQRGLTKRLTGEQVEVPGFLSVNSHMVSTLRPS